MKFLHALLSFFSRTANILAFLLLIGAGFSAQINPGKLWFLGLLGLAYPYIVLLNIFFVISWVLRKRLFFLLSLAGILLTFSQFKAQYAFPFLQKKSTSETQLTVMSYNVRNFDLYNWTKNAESRKSMMDTIQMYNPDILMIQEYYSNSNKKKNFNNEKYLSSIGFKYKKLTVELVKDKTRVWGVALFSKYPIVDSGEILKMNVPSPYGNYHYRGVYADIKIKNQTIRAISAHLQSIHFGAEDYETIEGIKESPLSELKKSLSIIKKLKRAFIERGHQTDELKAFIENSPYPVILGGDFNDTPGSYAYQQIAKTLSDAHIQKGKGLGSTYNGIIPFLRIDFILHDKSFDCTQFIRNNNPNSDHFPIVAGYALPDKP